jgi:hypothetical protein
MSTTLSHQRSGVIVHHGDHSVHEPYSVVRTAKTPSDVYPSLTHQFIPKGLLEVQKIDRTQREDLSRVLAAGYLNRKGAPVNNFSSPRWVSPYRQTHGGTTRQP